MNVPAHFADVVDVPALWMFQRNKCVLTVYMYGVFTALETSPYCPYTLLVVWIVNCFNY